MLQIRKNCFWSKEWGVACLPCGKLLFSKIGIRFQIVTTREKDYVFLPDINDSNYT